MDKFVYVSDQAWHGLDKLAERFNCHQRAKLLSRLPAEPKAYTDNRPDTLRDMDYHQLMANRFPMWSYEYTRYPRHMHLDDQLVSKALRLCEYWHITDHRRKDSHSIPISRIGALLEALGLELLQVKGDYVSIMVSEAAERARASRVQP